MGSSLAGHWGKFHGLVFSDITVQLKKLLGDLATVISTKENAI